MAASVARSTAEVTSSRTISLGLRKRDRARQTSCLWPWERFAPPGVMRVERLVKLTVIVEGSGRSG